MRFASLTLERYGRFEDCSLSFRPGAPDLHIIYGPNEAGKSTTLAAVSDLLFGFTARTSYDFRFDKALLRIGARLEEDGRTLDCRRRKGNAATLLDADDRPIDEAVLLGMLRGQTRDGFKLAFSLDQQRLRLGGRAMVEAKDDVGQALFAAGSGLTEVAGTLDHLNEEADAIWGRRGTKRLFAVAEREDQEAQRRIREAALKPKAWTDARGAAEKSRSAQTVLEQARELLSAEQRRVERVRRVGPGLRRREELLGELATFGNAVSITSQREGQAEAALVAATEAERRRAAATMLLGEAETRMAMLDGDDAVLAAADRIDDLAERRGAYAKAVQDRARLVGERRVKEGRIAELRRELGTTAVAIPPRPSVSRLRDIAKLHADATSGIHTMGVTVADLVAREKPLRDRIADATLSDGLPILVVAVDAAYRLGADIDIRCDATARESIRSEAAATTATERLSPWSGSVEMLSALASLAEEEITAAQGEMVELRLQRDREVANAVRLDEEAAAVALEIATLADGGQGVPAEAVVTARSARDAAWGPVAAHLRSEYLLDDPRAHAAAFERAVGFADGVADLRFASAQASGRLGELDARRMSLKLQATQSRRRGGDAAAALIERTTRWSARLADTGLPDLEPIRIRTWLVDRQAALEADRKRIDADDRARSEAAVRAAAVRRLKDALPETTAVDPLLLAPILEVADVLRREGEALDASFREDRAEMREIERSLDEQRRRLAQTDDDISRLLVAWRIALDEAGVEIAVVGAEAKLAVFEELRAELDAAGLLDNRLDGIDVENARFETDVAELGAELGKPRNDNASVMLTEIRGRLEVGREKLQQLKGLLDEIDRRQGEINAASATHAAAINSAAPIRGLLALADDADLATAIERSRSIRALREELATLDRQVLGLADGYSLADVLQEWQTADPDDVSRRGGELTAEITDLNARISEAATESGKANLAFSAIEGAPGAAAAAATDAEQARAEMAFRAEDYLLKRAQAVMLRWAMDQYRERRQDPLLVRASELFRALTMGRYLQLRVDLDGATPRLGGLCDDGRTIVDVGSMSEGTTDQLFLALRLAAMEQSVAAGVRLPFLADDLFVNFDDDRAEAGFRVLAELAKTTQVLFFTHHPHLAVIAARVVGAELHSECVYP